MRPSSVVLVVVVAIGIVLPPSLAAQDMRGMAMVHTRLVADALTEIGRQRGQLQESWARVDAGVVAMLDAQQSGADLKSLREQDEGLRSLEAQLLIQVFELQRTRRDMLTNLAVVEAVAGATAAPAAEEGPLTGTWRLTVQPGLTGTAYLVQQGTLISGTYELSGGWTGSLRGTLVANKVRLERIDSQLGFAAVFYGELDLEADPVVIQGRWEATQLATGLPSAGGWRAQRED